MLDIIEYEDFELVSDDIQDITEKELNERYNEIMEE